MNLSLDARAAQRLHTFDNSLATMNAFTAIQFHSKLLKIELSLTVRFFIDERRKHLKHVGMPADLQIRVYVRSARRECSPQPDQFVKSQT